MHRFVFVIIPLLLTVACGKTGSPVEPSTTSPASTSTPAPVAAGATIHGVVTGPSGSTSQKQAATGGGLTVSVAGTTLSSPVDASNRFELQGVPAGDRQLRFTGPGVDAQLAVPAVQVSETIDLTVAVTGSSVTVSSQSRSSNPTPPGDVAVELEGIIQSFSGNASGFQFQIGSKLIKGDSGTQFFGNTVFADLANGAEANVKGAQRDGFVYANRIHVSPPETEPEPTPPVDVEQEIEGRVEALPPTTAAGSFVVDGKTVKTDSATTFKMDGKPAAFSDLVIGFRVHVKARTSGSNLVANEVNIQNMNADLPVEINGVVQSFTGTAADFQFQIGSRLIKGDSGTELYGNSKFADLKNGAEVEVKGLERNGFVYASRLHVGKR